MRNQTALALLRPLAAMILSLSVAALGGCAAETDDGSPDDSDSSEDELRSSKPFGPNPDGAKAQYPIVLVHGFTGSRKVWNFVDVPAALEKDGHEVFAAELHPFGTPDENAKVLSAQKTWPLWGDTCNGANSSHCSAARLSGR